MQVKLSTVLISLTVLLSGCDDSCSLGGQKHDDVVPNAASWTIDQDTYYATSASMQSGVLTSSCDANNALFIRVGPLSATDADMHGVRLVDYNKATLGTDEIAIDITHGVGLDYLSTGDTVSYIANKPYYSQANVQKSAGKLYVTFSNANLRGYGSNGPTTVTTVSNGSAHED